MDKRTKILSIIFLGMIGVAFCAKVVYPRWVEPLLKIDEIIAKKQTELDKLEHREALVEHGKTVYGRLAARVGSMDIMSVRNDVHNRLNELIESHNLQDAKVTPRRRANIDSKTGVATWNFGISADGRLRDVVEFLKDAAELPHLLVIDNPKIGLASKTTKNKGQDRMSLSATVVVRVLPDQKLVGKINSEELVQPDSHQRHLGRDYAMIWDAKPFFEYEKPRPKSTKRPDTPKPKTSKKPEPKPEPKPKPELVKSKRWRDAGDLQLCMTMLVNDGASRYDEVMLFDTKGKRNRYVAVGEDFDGGSLLYVHQRGVLVGREDGDFVYPIGETLKRPIRINDADEFPELQYAHQRLRREEREQERAKAGPGHERHASNGRVGLESSSDRGRSRIVNQGRDR